MANRLLGRRAALLFALGIVVLAAACAGDDDATPTGSPADSATVTASPTLSALPTLQALAPIGFSEPAVLYGAEAGDGAQAVTAGDFNGDGELDIVLGAPLADGADNAAENAGEAYVFFGPFAPGETRDAGNGEEDATLYGRQAGDEMGRAVGAGDVTGDGIDDIVLGAPRAGPPEGDEPGVVYVVPGRSIWPAVLQLPADGTTITGAGGGDLFGFALDVGDATGDGIADVLATAFLGDGPGGDRPGAGEAYLVSGSPSLPAAIDLSSATTGVVTVSGAEAGGRLGENAILADLTDDGVEDLILSATFTTDSAGQEKVGAVYVVAGGEGLADQDLGGAQAIALGTDAGDQLGHSAATGDVDGDGMVDLLLGAVSADGPGNGRDLAGEVIVVLKPGAYLGDRSGEPQSVVIYGGESGHRVGRSVGAGDLDGDGRADLLLAGPGADETGEDDNTGKLFVIFGRDQLPPALELTEGGFDVVIAGRDPGDIIGNSVLGRPSVIAADFDGDGRDDIVVAALGDGPANDRADAGEVNLFFSQDP
jgi:hypothetical protein